MTGAPPHFSVIIPCFNGARFIRQTVESVMSQSEMDWELIIVDDGSTDATHGILGELDDGRIRVISQQHQGVSIARNRGLAEARGAYVLFLDADDVLFPSTLRRLGKELDEHPEAVLSFGACTRFISTCPTEAAAREPIRLRRKPRGDALAALLTWNPLLIGGVLVRRRAITSVAGFDPSLAWGEDWVFWCGLAAVGTFRYVGRRPVFAYRCHQNSATRRQSVDPEGLWPAIDKAFAQEAVIRRFSPKDLKWLRRRAEASALAVAFRQLLRRRDWRRMPGVLWGMLKRDPLSCLLDATSLGIQGLISAIRWAAARGSPGSGFSQARSAKVNPLAPRHRICNGG